MKRQSMSLPSSPYTLTLVAPPTPLFYRQSPLVKRLSFVIGVLFSRRHHDEPLHRVAPDLGVG
ncbi:MAG: hypothetical protein PVS3B3_02700 [Ktedonobacteraceae bacterium]